MRPGTLLGSRLFFIIRLRGMGNLFDGMVKSEIEILV